VQCIRTDGAQLHGRAGPAERARITACCAALEANGVELVAVRMEVQ